MRLGESVTYVLEHTDEGGRPFYLTFTGPSISAPPFPKPLLYLVSISRVPFLWLFSLPEEIGPATCFTHHYCIFVADRSGVLLI